MEETGGFRCPGPLDPRAQEFRPRNPSTQNQTTTTTTTTLLQPQIYYPYPFSEMQVMRFDGGGIGYNHQSSPSPAYFRPTGANPPLPPPLPPPSATATRTLLLSSVPTDVMEATVRRELEVFGEVRAVQMERLPDGIVTVHFYDLRHAQAAMSEIREQHMQQQGRLRDHYNALLMNNLGFRGDNSPMPVPLPPPARGLIAGRAVWAQFTAPAAVSGPDEHNQGTLVVFNLDAEVSPSKVKEIFEAFGSVKELRETPLKRNQRFVEFFDVRDAARALSEMNGKEIQGKVLIIELSRPAGYGRRFLNTISTRVNTRNSFCTRNAPPPPPPAQPPNSRINQAQLPRKKSGLSRGNPSWNCSQKCNYGSVGIDHGEKDLRKNSNTNKNNNFRSPTIRHQHQQQPRNRSCKGRQKNSDDYYKIKDDPNDPRTTVMIKNIPNKYSQKLLLNMLDNYCIHCNEQIADRDDQPLSSYDFVYLPIDFNNKCNVGYGFVNLTSPQTTLRLYRAFHLQPWEVFNSRKICEVTYARLQGLEALNEHFKNSKFVCEIAEYLPVVFSPPRDGEELTEPLPLVGHATPNAAAVNKEQLSFIVDSNNNNNDGKDDETDGGDDNDDDNGSDYVDDKGGSSSNGCDYEEDGGARLSETVFAPITVSTTSTSNGCLTSTEPKQQQQPKALSSAQVS